MERAVAAPCRGSAGGCSRRPVNLSAPLWVDDPDFEIDYHVRRIALPKPGTHAPAARPRHAGRASTRSTAPARCGSSPSSRACRGGKAALVQKMHHTITDGEGGVQMSLQYLDFERDAAGPDRRRPQRRRPGRRSAVAVGAPRRCATSSWAGCGCRSASPSRCATCSPTRRPSRRPARPPSTPCAASSPSSPTPSRRTRRCGRDAACSAASRWPRRRSATPRTPPSASAARSTRRSSRRRPRPPRRYHRELGEPVDVLRASMAVSTRTDDVGRQRLLARPHARPDRARCRSPSGSC